MTQAPTPGPLSGEDVKLLMKGDLLLCKTWGVVRFDRFDDSGVRAFVLDLANDQVRLMKPINMAFIGRPGADGWMPWSGVGASPVPLNQLVEYRLRSGEAYTDPAGALCWPHAIEGHDIITFRLAPTAPVEASGQRIIDGLKQAVSGDFETRTVKVEASGSEREHGPKCWGKTSISDEMMYCYCGSTDSPPGETREAVRLALEDADALERVSEEADDNQWQDWAATMRQAASRIRRLALLSARPLALGGQRGDSETLRVLLDNLVIAQTLSKDIRQKATDEARSYLYDLRHTPQPSGEARELAAYFGTYRHHVADGAAVTVYVPLTLQQIDAAIGSLTTPARAEAQDEDTPCTDCGDTGVTHQTERRCSCQEAEAQDEGALSVLDRLLNYSGARGSFDAMKHGDAVKDAEELLRSVKSPSHTDLMVTPESIDAYMKVNPMEAQDEGAAGELKPCPFCGGEAEIIHLDDGDNAGGSCVCCTKCQASGNVEFGRKENFVDNWNRRAHPSPTPAADADRVRIADADSKWLVRWLCDQKEGGHCGEGNVERRERAIWNDRIDRILAALKSTAVRDGSAAP